MSDYFPMITVDLKQMLAIFNKIPKHRISALAIHFALNLLEINQKRLLNFNCE